MSFKCLGSMANSIAYVTQTDISHFDLFIQNHPAKPNDFILELHHTAIHGIFENIY